jgi:glycosyltransferase involved in cell wall biosynthesis
VGDEFHPLSIQNPKSKIQNSSKTRFVFFGGGKRREEIRNFIRKHPGGFVELHDYVAPEMLGVHLRSADVHLVSLDAEWTGTMVPSKLQGIFEAERPVVFIGSPDSSIGCWVRESGGGWVVEPGDVAALAEAIEEAGNPQERARRGRAAKLFADLNFDRKTNVARVAEVLGGSAGRDGLPCPDKCS